MVIQVFIKGGWLLLAVLLGCGLGSLLALAYFVLTTVVGFIIQLIAGA